MEHDASQQKEPQMSQVWRQDMTAFNSLQCLHGGDAEDGVDTGFGTRTSCQKEASHSPDAIN